MYQVFIKMFKKLLGVFGLLFLLVQFPVHSEEMLQKPAGFEQGKQYRKIELKILEDKNVQQFIAQDPKKIQVIEFFNYGCFWCSHLHPVINNWVKQKPSNVVFYRFPLVFNKHWETFAKAYYVIKELNANEKLDEAFFTSLHQNHVDLSNEKILQNFFVEHGIPGKKFSELYNSFTINTELTKAKDLANAYQISVSPVIILNAPSGSYLLTAAMAGSEQGLIDVLNYLISIESKKTNA